MLYCMSVPIYFFVQAFKNIDYLGSTKIGFHKQFVLECKGCLIALKDRLVEDCACFELLFYHERQSLTSLYFSELFSYCYQSGHFAFMYH